MTDKIEKGNRKEKDSYNLAFILLKNTKDYVSFIQF